MIIYPKSFCANKGQVRKCSFSGVDCPIREWSENFNFQGGGCPITGGGGGGNFLGGG